MTILLDISRTCLAWIATDEEREERLGDLEEAFGHDPAAYTRAASLCFLLMLRRRVTRALLYGGQDMVRIFVWAIFSVFVTLGIFAFAGGELDVLVQPFEWAIILLVMLGFALGSGRVAGWGQILQDLRRADRLKSSGRSAARSAAIAKMLAAKGTTEPNDFPHLQTVIGLARTVETDAAPLIGGSIALYRDRSAHQLQIVRATITDAYIGAAIAFLLGLIHIAGSLTEPPEVLGHLLAGAACALFVGMMIAHAVIAPIGGRLSGLYEQESREMEAMRVSLKGGEQVSFASAAFEMLTASGGRHPAKLSLLLGMPAFLAILGLIALTPMGHVTERLGLSSPNEPQGVAYYDMPEVSLNLNAPGQPVLTYRLALQFDFSKAAVAAMDTNINQLMDAAQGQIREMAPEDFRGSEKLTRMQQSLLARFTDILKPQPIKGVIFKEAVVR